MSELIEIDGAEGEGGGQIIRSSLALSLVTGKPLRIFNVRGKRKKSGLLAQHLTALNAAREVCGAGVTGNVLHSSEFTFAPGPIQTRKFEFKVGTAGSAILVAQTVLPALILADGESTIVVEGGTHNSAAPPFDFLQLSYLPLVEKMGPAFKCSLERYGFYPAGGGQFSIAIKPVQQLQGLEVNERGDPEPPQVVALVSKLPRNIGERECDVIRRKFAWRENQFRVAEIENSPGPGNAVMIQLPFANVTEVFTAFGRRGLRSEDVARAACRQAKSFLDSEYVAGEYLADQLLLPMALAAAAGSISRFTTGPLSGHSITHIDVIQRFLDIQVNVNEISQQHFEIELSPGRNND